MAQTEESDSQHSGRCLMRRKLAVDEEEVEVLRVPWFSQSDVDSTCVPCSVKMCLEYFRNVYGHQDIREHTPALDIGDIMGIMNTRETGTRLTPTVMSNLQKSIPCLKLDLKADCSVKDLRKSLNKNLPVIALYNCCYLLNNERGPGHAGVVIGLTQSGDVILTNPWLGSEYFAMRPDFEESWELEYCKAIFFRPFLQKNLEADSYA